MLAVAMAALVVAASSPDPLEEARSAFDRSDYAAAERTALAAATPPREGAALYLAGLASFRAGRAAQALALLDRAGRAVDAPPAGQWHFNRAACLDGLERFAEAEAEYVAAAGLDVELAPLALVNAGYVALDAGAPERARAHAAKARAVAKGSAASELVAALEAQLDGASEVSASASPGVADRDAQPGGGKRWAGVLRAEGGWDSNPLYAGDFADQRLGAAAGEAGSAVGVLEAGLSGRFPLAERLRLDLGYGFGQLAFEASAARDLSVQQHALSAGLVASPRANVHAGALVEGGLAFAGLSDYRSLQRSAGVRAWTAYDATERTTTRADLGVAVKRGGSSEFEYLDGTRIDAGLSQEVRFGRGAVAAGYRYLRDDIGNVSFTASCGLDCTSTSVVPLGYAGHTLFLSGRLRLAARLDLEVIAGTEWRNYLADDRTAITTVTQTGIDPGAGMGQHHDFPPMLPPPTTSNSTTALRRHDLRWFTGETLTWRLTPAFSLLARYEFVRNGSNLDERGAQRGYDKHAFTVGTALRW